MKLHFLKAIAGTAIFLSTQAAIASDLDLEREDGSEITVYLRSQGFVEATDLLVLMQGSDCNSVAHNALINGEFSQVLPTADVLTIEKYGITSDLSWDRNEERPDCPAEYIEHDSPERRSADYIQVIRQLKESKGYQRIILLGGSEGATVANMVAARADFVTASISLNGGGRHFIDDILHNMKASGMPEEAYEEVSEGFKGFAQQVATGKPFEVNMSGHGYNWWHTMLKTDQLEILAQIDTPLLIIQGGKDQSVSPDDVNTQIIRLKELDKTNVTYQSYAEMDHSFKKPQGESMSGEVVSDIQKWLAQLED